LRGDAIGKGRVVALANDLIKRRQGQAIGLKLAMVCVGKRAIEVAQDADRSCAGAMRIGREQALKDAAAVRAS
jgi:hypothetical protein